MDSINKQQPEDNTKDLNGEEATQKIKELSKKAKVCLFCSNIKTGKAFSTRPMSVQKVDDEGNLWFLSAADSNKNNELNADMSVQLLFQGSSYSDFLTLYGKAIVSKSKEKIKELWEPILKDWFTEGIDDPRITVIKVEPNEGYYWDTKHAQIVGLVKRVAGAVLGKTYDDSIEGSISV
jgi:general stress protein 26